MTAVVTAADVDSGTLDRFLVVNFRREKADFLRLHGEWWHRGQENRWVVEEGGQVIAYCAVVPTTMRVGGNLIKAAWWVDLVVDKRHRGKGLQTLLDKKIRSAASMIVGFPNAHAAKIHRHHGWGVREDLEVRLHPLKPIKIAESRAPDGFRGTMLRLGAIVAEPIAWRSRRRLSTYSPRNSRVVATPEAKAMARIFADHQPRNQLTTMRDESFLQWRYLDAPYRDQLIFISGGDSDAPRMMVVLRIVERESSVVARILDIFGDVNDTKLVGGVVRFAARCALDRGAAQVTGLAANSAQIADLRKTGFVIGSKTRFCWSTPNSDQKRLIAGLQHHFVLGDSDNDEP